MAKTIFEQARETIDAHPYLTAAAGGALIAAAAGSFYSLKRRPDIARLDKATDEEIEDEIAAGAIAY